MKLTGKGVIYGPEAFRYSAIKKHRDGSIEIHIPEVEEYKIMNFVLTWAGEAQVLSPDELVSKVSNAADIILSLHKVRNQKVPKTGKEIVRDRKRKMKEISHG